MTPIKSAPSTRLVLISQSYYSTFLRYSLAICFAIFALEIFNNSDFTKFGSFSLFGIFKFNHWILPLLPDVNLATQIILYGSLFIALSLSLGVFTRIIGSLLSVLAILGIISSPQIITSPLITLFQSHFNILIFGIGLSLFIIGPGPLSLRNHRSKIQKFQSLDQISPKQTRAASILRFSLAAAFIIIFASVFLWVSPNNFFWSFYFERTLNSISIINIPILSTIIGTASILIFFNIGTRLTSLITGIFFTITLIINGITAYPLLIIIGSTLALISLDDEQQKLQQIKIQQKNSKKSAKLKNKTKKN